MVDAKCRSGMMDAAKRRSKFAVWNLQRDFAQLSAMVEAAVLEVGHAFQLLTESCASSSLSVPLQSMRPASGCCREIGAASHW